MRFDATTDPGLGTWVPAGDADFPIQNLPYGAFVREADAPRLALAIGDFALDLAPIAGAGLFDDALPNARDVLGAPSLDALLACGRSAWRAVRARASSLLRAGDRTLHDAGLAQSALVPRDTIACVLPFTVADYVDFYSSLEHATNLGALLRPGSEPLLPNWRWLPVGYHGRSSTVACSGTAVQRPCGQCAGANGTPEFGATRALDFELEVAFITGNGPPAPHCIDTRSARDVIFGVALMNDWSARDIQGWEYRPLGPFLGKSFLTSLSPWIVTLDALEPYRVAAPLQHPPALSYLATVDDEAYDIALEVSLRSSAMRERGLAPQTIARSNFRGMYWTMAQQLAHVASNGVGIRAGDLYGSGTVSGGGMNSYGSLIELTWNGARPIELADGSLRTFLEDGDCVVMRGCAAGSGRARVGFGEVCGTVTNAFRCLR